MNILADIQRMVAEGGDDDAILELVDARAQGQNGRIRHVDDLDVEFVRSDEVEHEAAMYAFLKSLEISAAPETIATFPFGTTCIVVRRYWACPDERLVKLEDSPITLRSDAKTRFVGDMNRLFDHGKLYPYIRGDAHWLVSEKTGVIVLAPWLLIDASPRKREEHFESIERTFARHS